MNEHSSTNGANPANGQEPQIVEEVEEVIAWVANNDTELTAYIKAIIGRALVADRHSIQGTPVLIGKPGTGKSVILGLLRQLLGPNLTHTCNVNALAKRQTRGNIPPGVQLFIIPNLGNPTKQKRAILKQFAGDPYPNRLNANATAIAATTNTAWWKAAAKPGSCIMPIPCEADPGTAPWLTRTTHDTPPVFTAQTAKGNDNPTTQTKETIELLEFLDTVMKNQGRTRAEREQAKETMTGIVALVTGNTEGVQINQEARAIVEHDGAENIAREAIDVYTQVENSGQPKPWNPWN